MLSIGIVFINTMSFLCISDIFEDKIKNISEKFDIYIWNTYKKEFESEFYFNIILFPFAFIIGIFLLLFGIIFSIVMLFKFSLKYMVFLYNLTKFIVSEIIIKYQKVKCSKEKQKVCEPEVNVNTVYKDLVNKYGQ